MKTKLRVDLHGLYIHWKQLREFGRIIISFFLLIHSSEETSDADACRTEIADLVYLQYRVNLSSLLQQYTKTAFCYRVQSTAEGIELHQFQTIPH